MLDNITNHYTKDISCKLQTPTQKRSITKMSGIFLSQAVTETCQKYSVTVMFYYIFHIKPQFLKTLFQSQFLFDFDEIFTNRSENVRSFL